MIETSVLLIAAILQVPQRTPPPCRAEPGRLAEQVRGELTRGRVYRDSTAGGWILELVPIDHGWFLQVSAPDRAGEDLARLTPPWHGAPNPREIVGWHDRNADNTGPNDGSVNAPPALRESVFSPRVGRGIEYRGRGTTPDDVAAVAAFGRGWFLIESYELTPARKGERAAVQSLRLSACPTWPAWRVPRPDAAGSQPRRPCIGR